MKKSITEREIKLENIQEEQKNEYVQFNESNDIYLKDGALSKRTEYYRDRKIILFKGNVLDSDVFDKEFIDLIVTSPPYNVGIEYNSNDDTLSYEQYLEFSKEWMSNCYKWSKTQGRFLLNIPLDKNKGGQKSVGADLTMIAQAVGWKYHSTIIWNEGNISRRTAWGSWLSASAPFVIAPVELIVVLYKDEWKKTLGTKKSDISRKEFMDWTNGVWTFNGESKKRIGHPAPFPKELPRRAIKLFSYVNDVIFDPFVGSGTTLIEAANNNRIGIGLEIDDKYCKLASQRISKEVYSLAYDDRVMETGYSSTTKESNQNKKIDNSYSLSGIEASPNILYQLLNVEKLSNEKLIIEEIIREEGLILIKRILDTQTIESSCVGFFLIRIFEYKFNIDLLNDFIVKLEKFTALKAENNFKTIQPVLIAKSFDSKVNKFTKSYNKLQERKQILLINISY